jgi:DNA-directed RNA polymerase subunit RPC12/RpoP
MNQCMRCGGEVPEIAQACMHCGAVFTNTAEYQASVKADQENTGCALIIVVVVVVAALLYTLFTGGFD